MAVNENCLLLQVCVFFRCDFTIYCHINLWFFFCFNLWSMSLWAVFFSVQNTRCITILIKYWGILNYIVYFKHSTVINRWRWRRWKGKWIQLCQTPCQGTLAFLIDRFIRCNFFFFICVPINCWKLIDFLK